MHSIAKREANLCSLLGNGNPLQYSCLEKFHGQKSQVGHSPWGPYESDMTELLSTITTIKTHLFSVLFLYNHRLPLIPSFKKETISIYFLPEFLFLFYKWFLSFSALFADLLLLPCLYTFSLNWLCFPLLILIHHFFLSFWRCFLLKER